MRTIEKIETHQDITYKVQIENFVHADIK